MLGFQGFGFFGDFPCFLDRVCSNGWEVVSARMPVLAARLAVVTDSQES
jgi:hypothetical protein